jgi:hypothetical protein
MSRQWVSELLKLDGHPRPTKAGHNIAKWKRFIADRAEGVGTQAGAKGRLQIALLEAKLAREKHDLEAASGELRKKIAKEVLDRSLACLHLLVGELNRVPDDLPLDLVGCGARELSKLLKERLLKARNTAADAMLELHKSEGLSQESELDRNVVPFDQRKAAVL